MLSVLTHYHACPEEAKGGVVVLGNFDGVHRGHQAVIQQARTLAEHRGIPLCLLTFEPHPLSVLYPHLPPFRLTTLEEKARLLEALNVDFMFALPFTRAFSEHPARRFVEEVLIAGLKAKEVVTGEDFIFGHNRGGNSALLEGYATQGAFGYHCIAPVGETGKRDDRFSSTRIRAALREGDVHTATAMLGRPPSISGRVEAGNRRGKGLGFPTANLPLGEHLHPKFGVYAVRLLLEDGSPREGVANIGCNPTFGEEMPRLEVFLFDHNASLYDSYLRVALIAFLREERKFTSAEALTRQISEDIATAKVLLAKEM